MDDDRTVTTPFTPSLDGSAASRVAAPTAINLAVSGGER
jgi:hypothetical protein